MTSSNTYDAIIIGGGASGDKSPAQFMEATSTGSVRRLRADHRVRFSGLSCTEAGL